MCDNDVRVCVCLQRCVCENVGRMTNFCVIKLYVKEMLVCVTDRAGRDGRRTGAHNRKITPA